MGSCGVCKEYAYSAVWAHGAVQQKHAYSAAWAHEAAYEESINNTAWAHAAAYGISAEDLAWAHGLSSRNVPIVLCGLMELCSKKCAYSAVWAHEVD